MSWEFPFPRGVRELIIGDSFYNDDENFSTIKYDFKPETEALGETAKIEITNSDQVTVTHSNVTNSDDGAQVQYKGSLKPYEKECVLIIDHKTGEIRLEKLSNNIQLKRSRIVQNSKHTQKHSKINGESRMSHVVSCSGSLPSASVNSIMTSIPNTIPMIDNEPSSSSSSDNSSSDDEDSGSSSNISYSDEKVLECSQLNGNGSDSSFIKGHVFLDEDLKLSESGSSDSD